MLQLKMIFSATRQPIPEMPRIDPKFRLRLFEKNDWKSYCELVCLCGWNADITALIQTHIQQKLREKGFFVIEELSTGNIVASAMACHGYFKNYDNLSWVMTNPEYRGKSFGKIVCIAALHRSLDAGADGMTLSSDDFREPALRMYLHLGWRPWLYTEEDEMRSRWIGAEKKLGMAEPVEFFPA